MLKRWVALQHRDFRLLWLGLLVSFTGSQMQFTAVNWQVFDLLRTQDVVLNLFGNDVYLAADALGLGLLGLARVLPIFVFALVGGALADSFDRRTVMGWSLLASMVASVLLAAITLAGRADVIAIYLLTALGAAAAALGNPARQALVPNLVPKEHFTNAVSLNSLILQFSSIFGPALAGVLIGRIDIGWIYVINGITFTAALLALAMMRHRDSFTNKVPKVELSAIRDGFVFVFSNRMITSTMLLDFFATFFSSARTMLPIIASELLSLDAAGFGLLSTAQAVGSAVAGILVSLRKEIYNQGAILIISVAIYGLATALFGMSTSFVLSYFLFAVTGAADTVSTVIRNVIRQMQTPDDMRGRMVGVNQIFFQGGPQLGELEAGLVAAAFGVPFAVVSGGVATMIVAGIVARKYRELRDYKAITIAAT
jgi:MFS family permease